MDQRFVVCNLTFHVHWGGWKVEFLLDGVQFASGFNGVIERVMERAKLVKADHVQLKCLDSVCKWIQVDENFEKELIRGLQGVLRDYTVVHDFGELRAIPVDVWHSFVKVNEMFVFKASIVGTKTTWMVHTFGILDTWKFECVAFEDLVKMTREDYFKLGGEDLKVTIGRDVTTAVHNFLGERYTYEFTSTVTNLTTFLSKFSPSTMVLIDGFGSYYKTLLTINRENIHDCIRVRGTTVLANAPISHFCLTPEALANVAWEHSSCKHSFEDGLGKLYDVDRPTVENFSYVTFDDIARLDFDLTNSAISYDCSLVTSEKALKAMFPEAFLVTNNQWAGAKTESKLAEIKPLEPLAQRPEKQPESEDRMLIEVGEVVIAEERDSIVSLEPGETVSLDSGDLLVNVKLVTQRQGKTRLSFELDDVSIKDIKILVVEENRCLVPKMFMKFK